MRRLAFAIEGDNERQADRDLGGCYCDYEENEHLTTESIIGGIAKPRAGDQREIGSIEHQLEAHVNDQQVAPQQYPQQTQAKKDRADDEIVLEADVHLRLKR